MGMVIRLDNDQVLTLKEILSWQVDKLCSNKEEWKRAIEEAICPDMNVQHMVNELFDKAPFGLMHNLSDYDLKMATAQYQLLCMSVKIFILEQMTTAIEIPIERKFKKI